MRDQLLDDEAFRIIESAGGADDLADALAEVTMRLGFRYFALTQHVDIARLGGRAIRLHNYPEAWADYYDRWDLGARDPVLRASHRTALGFTWTRLPGLIRLTPEDRRMLDLGREAGIGDGFTVPANVPGEALASCSFVNEASCPVPVASLPRAHLIGVFAFEAARRLWSARPAGEGPALTERQRDCLLWVARGKSDWEISRILGVSQETVVRHVKDARERYGVQKRTLLAIRALLDGTISFMEILRR